MTIRDKIKRIPDVSGIYLFFKDKDLVYVGKATSLKKRVSSYFSGMKSPRPIEIMISDVNNIKYVETDSVIEAIILEANYIKKYQPKYNIEGKDDKSWNYLVLTRDEFPHLQVIREHNLKSENNTKKEYKYLFGPFPSIKTKEMLKILHNLFYVSRCDPEQKRPCFDYQIGHCLGVCAGEIGKVEYRERVVKPLVYFLSGKKKTLLNSLERQMKKYSSEERFEDARQIRDQIKALSRIRDIALLDKSFLNDFDVKEGGSDIRIEGFDISNFGIDAKVGSMVVFNNKTSTKSEYKKFKIKEVVGQSDVDCLREVIVRRFNHKEWKFPDIILIDGGKPQVNTVKRLIHSMDINIPIVGIAKGKDRKKNEFIYGENEKNFVDWVKKNEDLLISVRDEAHRFAISYQRQTLRKNKLI
ncbi:UvrB/UvrC motif-containing protein [bacterium]|nr:UvrB/UvrC motif-containing protein [bacterium]